MKTYLMIEDTDDGESPATYFVNEYDEWAHNDTRRETVATLLTEEEAGALVYHLTQAETIIQRGKKRDQ